MERCAPHRGCASGARPAALREPHPCRAPAGWPRAAPSTRGDAQACHVTDPGMMQDVVVGGAVAAAVSAALVGGFKQEPCVCESCAGSGGVRCFACEGTGTMSSVALEELAAAAAKRDPLGRAVSKRECRACKGAGLLFCKKCSGSGYR